MASHAERQQGVTATDFLSWVMPDLLCTGVCRGVSVQHVSSGPDVLQTKIVAAESFWHMSQTTCIRG